MSFLQRILPAKQAEVRALKAAFDGKPAARDPALSRRDFAAALAGGDRVIAEIKHKSPSHPAFVQAAVPATLARAYQRNGAAALSIVTDTAHFGTSLADVAAVKAAVDLPVLVKDFVIDEVQLRAAWNAGADAALLIVRMLDGASLERLLAYATQLGLQVLVECHDEADIALAVAAEARLIGVNNRNLATLKTDLEHGAALLPHVPTGAVRISESGLYRRADVLHMADCGADAFLIGHALLQSRDPGRKVAELCGQEAETGVRVKTCGITTVDDAVMAHAAGSHILGLIFAASPRQITSRQAAAIRAAVPAARLCGVFVDEQPGRIADVAQACDLDIVQLHGDESPAVCREVVAATGLPLIKALTVDRANVDLAEAYAAAAYILVDLPKGSAPPDEAAAACIAAARALTAAGHDVLLAGGLTAQDVRAACAAARPFGVDVASGIERSPGRKDPDQTRAFIREATG